MDIKLILYMTGICAFFRLSPFQFFCFLQSLKFLGYAETYGFAVVLETMLIFNITKFFGEILLKKDFHLEHFFFFFFVRFFAWHCSHLLSSVFCFILFFLLLFKYFCFVPKSCLCSWAMQNLMVAASVLKP